MLWEVEKEKALVEFTSAELALESKKACCKVVVVKEGYDDWVTLENSFSQCF